MIPRAHITAWRAKAPRPDDGQVEQDLVLSRALVEIFSDTTLATSLALRGGTAFHKVILGTAARYSEDIDLVQTAAGPIGHILGAIRARLDPWLGEAKDKRAKGGTTITYKFDSEIAPIRPLRVKLEINTREHFTVFGHIKMDFAVQSPWFTGAAKVVTFSTEELLGTKLRALYQRKKGRDLFDLGLALKQGGLDAQRVIEAFKRYIAGEGTVISRLDFDRNLAAKMNDPAFVNDIRPLLLPGTNYDPAVAHRRVIDELISGL